VIIGGSRRLLYGESDFNEMHDCISLHRLGSESNETVVENRVVTGVVLGIGLPTKGIGRLGIFLDKAAIDIKLDKIHPSFCCVGNDVVFIVQLIDNHNAAILQVSFSGPICRNKFEACQ
jgi:hypothetical protein